jgi:hypothetical protein
LIKGSALFFHVAFYEAVESNFSFCQDDVVADDSHDCLSKICDKPFLAAMRAQLIHYLDTSCKWGTHVLRFFWHAHRNFRDVELLIYP